MRPGHPPFVSVPLFREDLDGERDESLFPAMGNAEPDGNASVIVFSAGAGDD
jgi:hypothetical protein